MTIKSHLLSTQQRRKMGTSRFLRSTSGQTLQLNIIMILIATLFIVSRIPYTIMYLYGNLAVYVCETISQESEQADRISTVRGVTGTLTILNYCANFFLYCLSGSSFRTQTKRVLCRCCLTDPVNRHNIYILSDTHAQNFR